jgi:hypothetical protein
MVGFVHVDQQRSGLIWGVRVDFRPKDRQPSRAMRHPGGSIG